jgi:hypothetical protein
MSAEDKFKEKLRDLADSKEFTFEERDWDSASAYVEQQRRRSGLGLSFLSLLMFLISGSALLMLQNENGTQPVNANTLMAGSFPVKIVLLEPVIQATLPAQLAATEVPAREYALPSRRYPASHSAPVPDAVVNEKPQTADIAEATPAKKAPVDPTPAAQDIPSVQASTAETQPVLPPPAKPQEPEIAVVPPREAIKEQVPPTATVAPEVRIVHDTVFITQTPAVVPPATVQGENSWPLELEAGIGIQAGWKYNGSRDGLGIAPVGGIHLVNPVNDKFLFTVGLLYQEINRMSQSSVISKVSRLGLGEESQVTVITPRKSSFIGTPLRLHYHITVKDRLGLGYQVNYLLNVDANVEKYNERLGDQTDRKSYTAGGYVEGFRTFSSQMSLFYRREIHKGLHVNGEFVFGLTDLKDDGFFGVAAKERHSAFRLTVVYDLSRKNK